ncbi:MAG: hypothetical protein JSR59_26625 [Proteobacteria bacterium]|nr:hypothetical protein [Pseudomonadota bacterium]
MKSSIWASVRQHVLVAAVVLFALACACLPPSASLDADGADVPRPAVADVTQAPPEAGQPLPDAREPLDGGVQVPPGGHQTKRPS